LGGGAHKGRPVSMHFLVIGLLSSVEPVIKKVVSLTENKHQNLLNIIGSFLRWTVVGLEGACKIHNANRGGRGLPWCHVWK
jgi:hypothetical protein